MHLHTATAFSSNASTTDKAMLPFANMCTFKASNRSPPTTPLSSAQKTKIEVLYILYSLTGRGMEGGKFFAEHVHNK